LYFFLLIYLYFDTMRLISIVHISRELMKKTVLLAALLSIAGCASNIDRQKEDAQKTMDEFIERAEKFNQEFETEKKPLKQRRELMQFSYGSNSFENNNFLEYLVQSNANLPNDLIGKLRESENQYQNTDFNEDTNDLIGEIQNFKKITQVYKKLAKQKTVNVTETQLSSIVTQLLKNTGLKLKVDEIDIEGRYKGTSFEIIRNIAEDNNLVMYFSTDYKTLHLKTAFPDTKKFNPVINSIALNPFEVEKDLDLIEEVAQQLEGSDATIEEVLKVDQFVKTNYGRKIVNRLILVEKTRENVVKQRELASYYRTTLIQRAEEAEYVKTPTVTIFEDDINNGNERVIEKFSVYNDTPDAMFTKLQAFSVFNDCTVTETSTNDDGELETETIIEGGGGAAAMNDNVPNTVTGESVVIDDLVAGNANNDFAAIDQSAAELIEEANDLQADSALGCVDFIADDFGIVASGSILDIQLVEKFLVDQDQPVKQAMIETFILEVNSDWKNELESRFTSNTMSTNATPAGDGGSGLYSFTAGLLDFASATAEGGITASTRLGSRNQITALVNMIETNSLGKKISNPVILVRDGEEGVVDKTRTFRAQRSTTTTNSATTNTSNNQIDEYDAPLKLTVTPNINKHNDVIDLDFNFVEETYDSASPTAASTSNNITTKLKIEPGEVVMMAGLFQQTQSSITQGLPFVSKFGFSKLLSPLVALLGGGEVRRADTGTELLVFINPTVITKENINRTVTRTRY
jgi:type II secretory pathway component GspD/PulD (secretin)